MDDNKEKINLNINSTENNDSEIFNKKNLEPIDHLKKMLKTQKTIFNAPLNKELRIPATVEELLIILEYDFDEKEINNIEELEKWIVKKNEEKDDDELIKLFRLWKVNWNLITKTLNTLTPSLTKKEIETTPTLIIEKEVVDEVEKHIVHIEEDVDSSEDLLKEFGIIND